MSTIDPLLALEEANADYNSILNSQEYRIGKRVLKLKRAIKTLDFKALGGFARSLNVQRHVRSAKGLVGEHLAYSVDDIAVANVRNSSVIVYACVTNGYDSPHPPLYMPTNMKFVLYADEMTLKLVQENTHVDMRSIDHDSILLESGNPNRYCKMHPGALLDSEFAIYVDGNVQIICDVAEWCAIARASEIGVAMHAHSTRECAYEEARACILQKRGNPTAIKSQMERYKSDGFPQSFGMREATVIVSDLRNPVASRILDAWWNEYLVSGSGRDQLALPYVLWKKGYTIDSVACLGSNVWNSPKLRIHNLGSHSFK